MTRTLPRATAIVTIALAAVILTACSGTAAPEPTTSETASAAPSSPVPTAAPNQTAVPAGAPTCDTIIPSTTVDALKKAGWTAKAEPLRLGELVIEKGIQCTWGDYTVASDHVQVFGWAPVDKTDATAAEQKLVQTGWRREDSAEGTYITENPETAMFTDANGYGLTYLFGDGWVKYADTKQSLILIEWPTS